MSGAKFPLNPCRVQGLLTVLILSVISFLLFSCEEETRQARSTGHLKMIDAKVIDYNHKVVQSENADINDYITRHRWKMNQSATGLRYAVYAQGTGSRIVKGKEVRLRYTISLLDGTSVYNSDSIGLKVIYPGASENETGLQEALLLMREGDKARLIVPSHLAYGLLGDLNRIPAGATLVYDIEIVGTDKRNR